jgi:hypothetical protein
MQVFINLIVPINETNHIIKKKKKTLHKHSNKIQEKLKNDKKMKKRKFKILFVIKNKILVAHYFHIILLKNKCFPHSSICNTLSCFVR